MLSIQYLLMIIVVVVNTDPGPWWVLTSASSLPPLHSSSKSPTPQAENNAHVSCSTIYQRPRLVTTKRIVLGIIYHFFLSKQFACWAFEEHRGPHCIWQEWAQKGVVQWKPQRWENVEKNLGPAWMTAGPFPRSLMEEKARCWCSAISLVFRVSHSSEQCFALHP